MENTNNEQQYSINNIGTGSNETYEQAVEKRRAKFIAQTKCNATPSQKCTPFDDKWCDDCDYRY